MESFLLLLALWSANMKVIATIYSIHDDVELTLDFHEAL